MLSHYEEFGIKCVHSPINDFDEEDLVDKLQGCIDELAKLIDEVEGKVYVHCTAGM